MQRIIITTFLLLHVLVSVWAQDGVNTKLPDEAIPADKEALIFLIAGQSNAGGVAAFSSETNEKAGMAEKHPTIPGSTAEEVGIPTNKVAYPKSYIWKPWEEGAFEPLTPGRNLLGGYNDPNRHGIELPMAMLLEEKYPQCDKFFIKHGPGGHNLHTQWAAWSGPDYQIFLKQYDDAMADLKKRYEKVRVIGLYWDQGESDEKQPLEYEKNLRALFAALRKDTEIPDLQIYLRKHLFQHDKPDFKPIIDAQVKLTKEDPNAHLLDLDLGSNEKNFKAWAWTDNNGHLSSKAYLELSRRIMDLTGKNEKTSNEIEIQQTPEQLQGLRKEWGPFVGPWQRYDKNPIIGLEDKETYSIQNGPQSVIRWKDKWYMFLMTSQPMVTKLSVSDDGLNWERPHHDYLLQAEMPWEGTYNLAKAAVVRDDEVWLYYFGKKDGTEMIGLARSGDLENWTKEPEPIFTYGDSRIDGTRVFPESVIKEGDTWYMYYDVGFDDRHPETPLGFEIGVATSPDGVTWTDSPRSPVLTTGEHTADSWDDFLVSQCSVTKIGDWFFMLYTGGSENHPLKYKGRKAVGLARARHPEGPWEKYPRNPVFKPTGNDDDFDGIFLQHPCPVKVGKQWRLYYNGWTTVPKSSKRPVGAEYAIGIAFTKDSTPAENGKKKLTVISEHQGPVIGPNHPDVKASNNQGGFETGQVVKHNEIYHMFINEMFGRPHLDLRCAHWTSTDAVNWERQSTVVKRIPGRSHTNLRSEVWLTGVEYNGEEEAWNIFYVAYRGGDPDKGENFGSDYKGRIFRARSVVAGSDGIAGPYLDVDIIMQPDENTQEWEGDQGVDSFNPYKVGNKWYAFYGGHYHIPRGPWPVGLAHADKLSGPWERMPESTNPVPIVEEFTENPVVSKLDDGRYLAIFDSYGDQEIAYSISEDGVNWPPETRLKVQSGNNTWAEDGDHATRTPLCTIQEDDGTFTVIYTAMKMVEGKRFYAVGKCTLGWE